MKKIQLGQLLLEDKLITQAQLDTAMLEQKATGDKLGNILIRLKFIKEDVLLSFISKQLKIPYIDLSTYIVHPKIVSLLSELNARHYRALVLNKEQDDTLLVGMVDPTDLIATDELQRILKKPLTYALIREEDFLQMIDTVYRRTAEISNIAGELSAEIDTKNFDVKQLGMGATSEEVPVVRLLQTLFEDAVQVNASDIHIEPDETVLRIRLRIDGVLFEQIINEKQVAAALTLRLKLMARLNIAEKRLPQDGRFTIQIKNKNYDVRLSTLPTQFGESVVMRLLNQSGELLKLEQIGMSAHILLRFRRVLSMPHGLVLITGPTGSGKTTTLYGALHELNTPEKKILTVEDPVEYRLPRISQVQVQPIIDLTFAKVLRHMLRQDPDIIMVGELRDSETVSIALRAALTGHLVLATLHTNDSISSAVRLIDMEAEGFLVGAVLRAVVAQRLVRRICQRCSENYKMKETEKIWLNAIEGGRYSDISLKYGAGCTYCNRTGYKGQVGVYEYLEMNNRLASPLRDKNVFEFSRLAMEDQQFKPLLISGLELATEGVTTISEIIRTVGEGVI